MHPRRQVARLIDLVDCPLERHWADRFLQFRKLDMEGGVGEQPHIADMIVVQVGQNDSLDC